MKNRGFLDDEHREKFEAGRAMARRGGPLQEICGAKTRFGQLCRAAPLRGHWRCLRHAGPKAARELRQRQLRAMLSGNLSQSAFIKLEARREVNRLQALWKRDPWVVGETIDLGNAEPQFQQAAGGALAGLPPAVSDWLRWQYKRFQLDRHDDPRWFQTLYERLPARSASAAQAKGTLAMHSPPVTRGEDTVDDRVNALRWRHPGWLDWVAKAGLSPRNERAVLIAALQVTENPDNTRAWERWTELVREFGRA